MQTATIVAVLCTLACFMGPKLILSSALAHQNRSPWPASRCPNSLQRKEIAGFAILDDAHAGKLNVTLYVGGTGRNQTAPLWVLGTDYNDSAVAYSCANYFLSLFHYDMGWIASRLPKMSQESINKVNEILASNGLNPNQFAPEIQDCGPLVPPN